MRKDGNIKTVNFMTLEGRHCHALTPYHTKYNCKEEIMQSANVWNKNFRKESINIDLCMVFQTHVTVQACGPLVGLCLSGAREKY